MIGTGTAQVRSWSLVAPYWLVVCALGGIGAASAETNYAEEYVKRMKFSQTIQPVGASPFGENINLTTGEVSFSHTDVVLEGIGPTIALTREFGRGDPGEESPRRYSGFGNWRLAIPHIATLTPAASIDNTLGGDWRVATSSGASTNRCTQFNGMWSPPFGYYGPKSGGLTSGEWWRGYQLVIPGAGSQEILYRAASNNLKPTSGFYPAVTSTHWQIGCLPGPITVNGQPQIGEGFLVISPDGTKYYLDHLSYAPYEMMVTYDAYDYRMFFRQPRSLARIYASKIEDRFGNVVRYGYTGNNLTSITASDGRAVSIEWWSDAPVVKRVTVGMRTWSYDYADRTSGDPRLIGVVLPDASTWELEMGAADGAPLPISITGCMPSLIVNASSSTTVNTVARLRNPSGALGTFSYSWRLHAQSYNPSYCDSPGDGQTSYETDNPYYMSLALVDKQVSGPGLTTATWHYVYEPPHASAARDCPNNTCQGTTYTEITSPDATVTRYTHSTRFDALDGKLMRVDHAIQGGIAMRAETIDYSLPPGATPYPSPIGSSTQGSGNIYQVENNIPLRTRTITEAGAVFMSQVAADCGSGTSMCYDMYSRPTKVIKSSVVTP